MTNIRPATSCDREAIHEVHLRAFPDSENELVAALAIKLLTEPTEPATINLAAEVGDRIIGHVAFSPVRADHDEGWLGYILAPLGVLPGEQGSGAGSQLVAHGLEQLRDADVDAIFVYGDPAYYGRFGFSREDAARFEVPYPLEFPHGWQAIVLSDAVARDRTVALTFKSALQDPAYW